MNMWRSPLFSLLAFLAAAHARALKSRKGTPRVRIGARASKSPVELSSSLLPVPRPRQPRLQRVKREGDGRWTPRQRKRQRQSSAKDPLSGKEQSKAKKPAIQMLITRWVLRSPKTEPQPPSTPMKKLGDDPKLLAISGFVTPPAMPKPKHPPPLRRIDRLRGYTREPVLETDSPVTDRTGRSLLCRFPDRDGRKFSYGTSSRDDCSMMSSNSLDESLSDSWAVPWHGTESIEQRAPENTQLLLYTSPDLLSSAGSVLLGLFVTIGALLCRFGGRLAPAGREPLLLL
eukprot:gnl/TRDRNA2_/TRDRNA2_201201_c0_seq1.p1 gnl/TRDRNA2_/TRDRNA2_201201_c0~~gnl/TRDRNA2_/TRDRNA2_201201_c0_seq1.p1  ORF type:complete len:287 (-),score=16.42 gnl/TRDRNA2_/TRDRNA2_201201_c0_seq1:73-933(-)